MAIGFNIGAANIKVMDAAIGTFFAINPFTRGIVPQSHMGKINPKKAAAIQDRKILDGNTFMKNSIGIQIW